MVGEIAALVSLGFTVIGSAWKLYAHFDERLDRMENERTEIMANVQINRHRIEALEARGYGRKEVVK